MEENGLNDCRFGQQELTNMTWPGWKPDAQVLGDSAVGHESYINLALAIAYHFRLFACSCQIVLQLQPTPPSQACQRVSASAREWLGAPQLVSTHHDSWPRRVSFSQDTVYQAIRKCVMHFSIFTLCSSFFFFVHVCFDCFPDLFFPNWYF